jgi:collagenase-like PrtC family protease
MAIDERGTPRLTLGPVLYLWEPEAWRDFHYRIADEADVDTVVLGEVVCSKRQHFHEDLIAGVAERLQQAGKGVRLASLALVTLQREMRASHRLAAQPIEVEVSELSAHAAMLSKPHAVGPLVNVYNAATARVLALRGATSICLPPELPLSSIAAIASARRRSPSPPAVLMLGSRAGPRIIASSSAARTPMGSK